MAEMMRMFFEMNDLTVLIVAVLYFTGVAVAGYFWIWKDSKNDKTKHTRS